MFLNVSQYDSMCLGVSQYFSVFLVCRYPQGEELEKGLDELIDVRLVD